MNKASGGDGIPAELFKILKDGAVKVPCSISQQIWKTQQWPQDWKRSVLIPIPKKVKGESRSVMSTSATLWVVTHQAPLSMEFSSQEYWRGCHSLLQGIFPTQGSNLGFLHCRQILYHMSHQGSPQLRVRTSPGYWPREWVLSGSSHSLRTL